MRGGRRKTRGPGEGEKGRTPTRATDREGGKEREEMITRKPVPRSLSDKDKDREGSDKASTSLHENRIPWRGGDPRTREGNQEGKERERGRLGLGLGLASSDSGLGLGLGLASGATS